MIIYDDNDKMGKFHFYAEFIRKVMNPVVKYPSLNNGVLAIDANGLIYRVAEKMRAQVSIDDLSQPSFLDYIISGVVDEIYELIKRYQQDDDNIKVYVAFDGVPPLMKIIQQRVVRHEALQDEEKEARLRKTLRNKDEKLLYSSSLLLPGTTFMNSLVTGVGKKLVEDKEKMKGLDIIVSGNDEEGEGEHKIIRFLKRESDKRTDKLTAIISSEDSDMYLLLSLLQSIINEGTTRSVNTYIHTDKRRPGDTDALLFSISDYISIITNAKEYRALSENHPVSARVKQANFLMSLLGDDFVPPNRESERDYLRFIQEVMAASSASDVFLFGSSSTELMRYSYFNFDAIIKILEDANAGVNSEISNHDMRNRSRYLLSRVEQEFKVNSYETGMVHHLEIDYANMMLVTHEYYNSSASDSAFTRLDYYCFPSTFAPISLLGIAQGFSFLKNLYTPSLAEKMMKGILDKVGEKDDRQGEYINRVCDYILSNHSFGFNVAEAKAGKGDLEGRMWLYSSYPIFENSTHYNAPMVDMSLQKMIVIPYTLRREVENYRTSTDMVTEEDDTPQRLIEIVEGDEMMMEKIIISMVNDYEYRPGVKIFIHLPTRYLSCICSAYSGAVKKVPVIYENVKRPQKAATTLVNEVKPSAAKPMAKVAKSSYAVSTSPIKKK